MNDTTRVTFEGGRLNGRAYDLPAGTTEVHLASLPSDDVYRLVVRDGGIFAVWSGATNRGALEDSSRGRSS